MSETYNIPRDSTLKELVALQKAVLLGSGDAGAIDRYFNGLVLAATSKKQIDRLFMEWWATQYKEGVTSRVSLLERWFGTVLDDDRVHGVKFPLFSTSQAAIGELTDDSAGLSCTPSTATTEGADDFARLPQFWCLEVSAEKSANGSHTIYAVEHIDDIATVRSGEHLCWVLQKNTYTREWDEGGYRILKMRCRPAVGYNQWPQGKDRTGKVYAYIANPKYYAGLDAAGNITCGTGLAPLNYYSHYSAVQKWRQRGAQYSGSSGNLSKFLLRMMWLKYARKGNSGTIEGCSSYYGAFTAAISETGVERVILSNTDAAAILNGCTVSLGSEAYGNQITHMKRVKAIEDITVNGAAYKAVYIDNGGVTFNTSAAQTYISRMPYHSGWNDAVLGNDGSRHNYTNGQEPGLLQKIEFQNGAYMILSDELWQWGKNANGDYTFDCYTCHDQSKVTPGDVITGDYTKQSNITMVFPATQGPAWKFIEDTAISADPAVLWPKAVSDAAGSGTGVKAAMYVEPAASGVRAAWVWGTLGAGGFCGLACRISHAPVGYAHWDGAPGAPGLAG